MNALDRLTEATSHPSPERAKGPWWQLAAALLPAPVAYSAQIVGSYAFAAEACSLGYRPASTLIVLNVVAVLVAVGGFAMSVLMWRRTRGEKAGGGLRAAEVGEGRTRFLALCGLWSSSIFMLAVLLELVAVFMLAGCVHLIAPE
jgi:hypothetical protein